ncbi:serine/threonine-protein kinase [Plantactinospora soyae]|uniref:non-specific serine/threonine protein kinase n=1 Tax=Plantactinospora soyae TaxID=1544732 RepID=A0A927MDV4_9ACTN|nr:serine/threonine-protein kinase [Plantactinospora soyae]MBE1491301.1 serine/threonine-protein kinase [Plantactinospora soyae]
MDSQQVLGGRYRLEDQLGQGGMAVVWRARDEVLGRSVAVKLLAGPHAQDPSSRRRIRHEARAAALLSHPNIAQVYDYGESVDGLTCVPYVVMELVSGSTLEQRLAAGPLPPKVAFRICAEVAAALAAAHDQGLVHRDIKPGNVMVTSAGAKVVDFGIAAAVGRNDGDEWGDELLGTPGYLAPERISGDAVEPASDVYGVGVLLYRLLAGGAPWSAETVTGMLRAHVYVEPAPLPSLPDVPAKVSDLCRRCLRKDPAQRPTAREVAAVLARAAGVRIVDDELSHSVAPAVVDGEPSIVLVSRPANGAGRPARRHSLTLAGAVATVAVVGTLVWLADPTGSGQNRWPGAGRPGQSGQPVVDASTPGTAPGAPTAPVGGGTPVVGVPPARSGSPGSDAGTVQSGQPDPTSDGGTPAPTTGTPPASPEEPPVDERTLSSEGGSVRATCTPDGDARLLSWAATRPYKVEQVDAGPATAATAAFRHGNRVVQMTITCTDGVPSTENTVSE